LTNAAAACTITVVIPALNEEANIADLITEVRQLGLEPDLNATIAEILVVDNGSTDRTAELAQEAGARVTREERKGYGRACLTGAEAATGEILVFMDGDRSEVPSEMPDLLNPFLDKSPALVIGSRTRGHMEQGALSPQQIFGNRFGSLLLRTLHGVRVTDFGPYRVIRRDVLLAFNMREMTYGWPTEMLVRSAHAPGGIIEVPVTCRRRAGGESKVSGSIRASITTGCRMVAVMFRSWLDLRSQETVR